LAQAPVEALHFPTVQSIEIPITGGVVRGAWLAPQAFAAERPALVFLHDALGSAAQWRDVPAALAEATGLPAFAYDRLGHGRSDPATAPRGLDYVHREALDVLPAVLDAAGVRRAVLVGHSDGGSIALLFAAAFPERVAAVVTEAAHVFVDAETLAGIRAAQADFETGDKRERLERRHGAKGAVLFHAWADTWLAPWFRGWNLEAELAAVRAPLLTIQGADDEFGSPAQLEAIAVGVSGPVRTLLLADCGHVPHRDRRDDVLEAVAALVRAVVPPP
jgi:pimeloyl-ACP methyl ester carboxylesterase